MIAGRVGGSWNEVGASFGFYLRPHLYQTRTFLGASISGALLLAWLLFRLRCTGEGPLFRGAGRAQPISQDIHGTSRKISRPDRVAVGFADHAVGGDSQGLRERLDEASNLTRYSLAEVRRAVGDLRSDELEKAGLPVALPAIAKRWRLTPRFSLHPGRGHSETAQPGDGEKSAAHLPGGPGERDQTRPCPGDRH